MPPDSDGSNCCPLMGSGWPDGGTGYLSLQRGWQPQVGSEEKVEFLTAVTIADLEDVADMDGLDCTKRSHILMGVLCVACETRQDLHEVLKADLEGRCVAAGRLKDRDEAERWIQRVFDITKLYVRKINIDFQTKHDVGWMQRVELLSLLLKENEQLFGRYTFPPSNRAHFD